MGDRKKDFGQHLLEYYLPFYYLLSLYSNLFVIGLGNALLLLLVIPKIRNGKISICRAVKGYLPFILWISFRDAIKAVAIGSITPIINMMEYIILFTAVFLIIADSFDEDRMYSAWKIAGIIYSLGLAYHLIQILILGNPVHPISILPKVQLGGVNNFSYRPCSFFSEPASFASAMLPLVFLALRKKDYYVAILASIMIIASTSTVGIALVSVLWLYTITVSGIKIRTKVLISLLLIGMLIYLPSSPLFNASFEKLSSILSGEGTFGTRIAVGFNIISKLNITQWIIGTNFIDVANYVSKHISEYSWNRTIMAYYYAGKLFLNSFSSLIYNYGIIGLLLYLRTIIRRFRITEYPAKALLLVHTISLFGQSTMLNSLFFQTIILLSLYEKIGLEKDETNKADKNRIEQ